MSIENEYIYKVGNDVKFPVTTLVSLRDDTKIEAESDIDDTISNISQGGVIKRAYVPHDVSPLVAVSAVEPDVSDYEIGDIYYNTNDKLLYRVTKNTQNELFWYTGANNADQPKSDRIFVDISTGKMYFWFNDDLNEVGGSSSGGSFGLREGIDYDIL